jgi:branched-chain amino acid transport system ATP-binding protein
VTVALSTRGLNAGYGPVEVLHGVDLDAPAGRVTAVLGRNGAGKTTLLRTLAGLLRPTGGTICCFGRDLGKLAPYQRARVGLLLIPEERGIFPHLTVEENLRLFAGDAEAFDAAFAELPVLERHLHQLAGTLSGGEQQMLALSRALLQPFRVLLVDELSRGLARPVAARLYRLLEALRDSGGTARAIVVVDQDTDAALGLADVVYVLRRGAIAFAGEPADLTSRTRH